MILKRIPPRESHRQYTRLHCTKRIMILGSRKDIGQFMLLSSNDLRAILGRHLFS